MSIRESSSVYPLRRFTDAGVEAFSEALIAIREGRQKNLSDSLVFNDQLAPVQNPDITLERRVYTDKLQMAEALHPAIDRLTLTNKYYDDRLWAWVTAFLFDTVCPPADDGSRHVGEQYRYILDRAKYYRHLIGFPVRLYHEHGTMPRLIYSAAPDVMGDVIESLASRDDIIMSSAILQAANLLYWDAESESAKTGISTQDKPGTLRRFVALMQQLDLTYDLQSRSMTGEAIVMLLPSEFNRWLES